MRVTVQVFRTPEGRLEGTVASASGTTAFDSTLDLLRVLEGLDLEAPTGAGTPEPRRPDEGEVR